MSIDSERLFSDAELVRAFNGSGIATTDLPDRVMAKACRTVAEYAITRYLATREESPALDRIANALEHLAWRHE